ncbi:a-pheromone processing metallopeptidase ste23 [Apiospora phragmitis]|uniref:A-pheromone processing metallopeptidase ste23 n=1 Tax=Apiospora phragmitis TaxID=2905665 RepID=A0ABR1VQ35_9PEZI
MFIKVSGYNNKLPVLLEQVLITMRDLEIRDERFNILTSKHEYIVNQLEAELFNITVKATRAFHKQLIS